MKFPVGLALVLTGGALGTALAACGGKNGESKLAEPPPQCPAGHVFDGQRCVPQAEPQPTATATATATAAPTPTIPLPIPTVAPGPNATPLDPTAAAAAVQLLGPLAKQHAPAGATPVSGASLAGNFATGQSLEIQVQMQPGRCYTIVGAALPTVQNLDIQLAPMPVPGVGAPTVAQDQTTGPTAVVGEKPNCFKWAAPFAGPMRVILSVSAGEGMAAAQVYQK
jgi:hypothetical protein